MKCSKCGQENNAGDNFCSSCKNDLRAIPPAEAVVPVEITAPSSDDDTAAAPNASAPVPPPPPQQPQSMPPVHNTMPPRPNVPQGYPQHPYYPPYAPRAKQPFTITDCYIIIGFVLAIIGIFFFAFILLPASIGFSIVGFVKRTNVRTLGLSIAGIVVGVVASLIKLGSILNDLGLIPDWLSAGIF